MKVKELLDNLGLNQVPMYIFHWGTPEEIENGYAHCIETIDIPSALDIFGEEDITQDGIYIETSKGEDIDYILNIWLKRETFQNKGARVKTEKINTTEFQRRRKC